ncbi:hypothetical protein TAMA11512_17820 [Selenomonas sp. TAMA-11512]|uniref:putative bifunctional diguanylate cyclase/phosphodiesterase n=1 Tax=Selenomonas sp. TAMA-11512 TaxID=3095337 RepID=UPI00308B2FA9|nr:hypothetical protein TAMA11512_17820 [Selenomonas sp. TAMA-11512]
MPRFSVPQAIDLTEKLQGIYQQIRFVDPNQCDVLILDDAALSKGERCVDKDRCFAFWGRSHRCRHCTSLCAYEFEKIHEKDEIKDGCLYHILSAPVELELSDKAIRPCVMELITSRRRNTEGRDLRDRMLLQSLSRSVRTTNAGIICFNNEEDCVYANVEAFRLFQAPQGELQVLQHFFKEWIDDSPLDTNENHWEQDYFMGAQHTEYKVDFHKVFDGEGRYTGYYYAIRDKSLQDILAHDENFDWTRDPLTGAYDQEGFQSAVANALEYGLVSDAYIICSNIKDFKLVNDFFGRGKGNEILCRISRIFKELVGESGIVGRLHSDHFAVLVDKGSFREHELLACMREISAMVESPLYRLCMHIGIYEIADRDMPVSVMCDRAHMALATVKDVGENYIAYYEQGLLERTLHEKEVLSRFDEALKNGEFMIYLQPQVNAESKLMGAEALVRWISPERGVMSPAKFIPILENAGIIYRLDQFVWESASALLAKWQGTEKENLHISVNISAKDTLFIDIYETFIDIVERHGISPSKLKLEITETALMSNIEVYNGLIKRLQQAGFQIEIDDFGSGYSSLATLKDIEADVLKIDMGFLQRSSESHRSTVILNSVISMSKNLGMPVITEGVETEEQLDTLRALGSDMFQGYYFAKPMPSEEFEARYFSERKKHDVQ